jgi:hypothetical protein
MVEYLFISSVMNGIWSSLCNVKFEIYHGALVMVCSTFDWSLWIILVFDGLAHPHSWIPYVQIGINMHLYIKVLFSRESLDFRPKSHDICRTFKLSCWHFVLCFCQVSFWSRYRPKYFTSVCTGIWMLLIVVGGQFVCFIVNVICEDFVWFNLIFHLSNHSCRKSRWCWSFCDANAGSLSMARRAVSSVKVAIVVLLVVGKSAVYIKYSEVQWICFVLFHLEVSSWDVGF